MEQVEALRQYGVSERSLTLFDATERATIQFTEQMTRNVQVDDATFAAVQSALGNYTLVVELTGVIATYNMVSRFLVALGVEPE